MGYKNYFLGFSPFDEETNFDKNSDIILKDFVLSVYKRVLANFVALTGDNYTTSKDISNQIDLPLIGW